MKKNDFLSAVLHEDSIIYESDRAILIKIKDSEFVFWHPKRMLGYSGFIDHLRTINFTKDWIFILKDNENITKQINSIEIFNYFINLDDYKKNFLSNKSEASIDLIDEAFKDEI